MRESLMLPAAIVVGCSLVALGLYFGLRGEDPDGDTPAQSAGVPSPRPRQPKARPTPAPPPGLPDPQGPTFGPPLPPPELAARVKRDAEKALEAQRSKLVATCWTPLAAKKPDPPRAQVTLVISFDPQGRENGRGVSEPRSGSRSDVAACLRAQPVALHVPAPGQQITVELPFTLP